MKSYAPKLRLLSLTLLFSVLVTGVALADNVVNDVVSAGVNAEPGETVTVQFKVVATHGSCNFSEASPLGLTWNTTAPGWPAGVTLPQGNPQTRTFAACGVSQSVQFGVPLTAAINSTIGVPRAAVTTGSLDGNNNSHFTINVVAPASTYTIDGFYQPVENRTRNTMKGGAVVPVKFNILDEDENKIDDPDAIELFVSQRTCASTTNDVNLLDSTETQSSGKTELRWDALGGPDGDGQWVFNWKSPKVSAETCYRILLEVDGDSEYADFLLRK